MAYEKLNLENGDTLTAEHIAHMEDGICNSAPAGYGLGVADSTPYCADANTAMVNGWYRIDGATKNGIGVSAIMRVESTASGWALVQTAYSATMSSTYAAVLQRYMIDGKWGEWEWVNPPMALGVEYRTTERHNGKVVYAKAINCGALPNASVSSVSHGISGATAFIDQRGVTSAGINFPCYFNDTSVGRIDLYVGSTIKITTTANLSSATATVTIKYTKD